MSFIDFFVSRYFIPLIISLVFNVFFVPFGIIGLRAFWRWYDRNFRKPKGGGILVRQKLPNDRLREFWVRPTGKFIAFKTYDGKDLTIPYKNEKGWIGFDGNIPLIYLDENNMQINLTSKNIKNPISQEEITMGYKASYETGKLIGSLDMFNDLKMWLIIGVIIIILSGVFNVYLGFSTKGAIGKIHIPSSNEIAGAFINITSGANRTYYNPQIPTVG